jgi:hypothetical protein
VRTTNLIVISVVLIAVAAGATIAGGVTAPSPQPFAESRATTRADRPCGRSFVEASVHEFLVAVNRGGRSAIDAAVATGSRFRVYSQTQRYGNSDAGFFSSDDRSRVLDHLLKRQAKGDRFRARDLDPNGYDRSFEICNLGFVLKRRIAGGPWRPFVGKGALDHPSGAISVWNVGGQCGAHASEPFPCPGD